jgi:hypothetical protein
MEVNEPFEGEKGSDHRMIFPPGFQLVKFDGKVDRGGVGCL